MVNIENDELKILKSYNHIQQALHTIGANSEDVAADRISQLFIACTKCWVTCQPYTTIIQYKLIYTVILLSPTDFSSHHNSQQITH